MKENGTLEEMTRVGYDMVLKNKATKVYELFVCLLLNLNITVLSSKSKWKAPNLLSK